MRLLQLKSGISFSLLISLSCLCAETVSLSQIDLRSLAFTEDTNILEIEILETYPGEKYSDLCIQTIIPCFTDTVTDGFNN